jgi:uncharacterized protein
MAQPASTPARPGYASKTSRTIAITGATGLIGTALSAYLRSQGHVVKRVVRRNPTGDDILWNPAAGTIEKEKLEGVDVVIHLAGHGIGEGKWTEEHKRLVLDSRVQGTTLMAKTLASLDRKPYVFVCGSAVGFYGNRGSDEITESSAVGSGFLAEVVSKWEACAAPATQAGIRTVLLRTGIVMSTQGGALKQQLLPFKLGAGGRLGPGTQYLPWISITDQIRAIEHVMDTASVEGPVNVCSPNPVTNATFTKSLGKAVKRPTIIPIPLFPLKAFYGPEMVTEMLLVSTKVMPTKLVDSGFTFTHPTIDVALRAVLDEKI